MENVMIQDAVPYYGRSEFSEIKINDDIVNSHLSTNNFVHSDANAQDYTIQVYSTKRQLYMVHQNNMVSGIRMRPRLVTTGMHLGVDKRPGSDNSADGVYLIETYYINRDGLSNSQNVLDYIVNSTNVDISNSERQRVHNYIMGLQNDASPARLRMITFIPDSEFVKNTSVYVKNANVVFTLLAPSAGGEMIRHPLSTNNELYESSQRIKRYEEPNVVSINITNNDNPNKCYYVKIGNNVHKVNSTTSNTAVDGHVITIKTIDKEPTQVAGDLNTLEDAGIYDTYEQAENAGDKSFAAMKLEHDKNKLLNDMSKLEADKYKQDSELESVKLKLDTLREVHKQTMESREELHRQALETKDEAHKQATIEREELAKQRDEAHKQAMEAKEEAHRQATEARDAAHAQAMEAKEEAHRQAMEAKEEAHEQSMEDKERTSEQKQESHEQSAEANKAKASIEITLKLIALGLAVTGIIGAYVKSDR